MSKPAPRPLPLRTQALRRLILITLLLSVGVVSIAISNYHTLIQREKAARAQAMKDHYSRLLPEVERAWQTDLMQLRQRLEYARLIEPQPGEPAAARWARLASLLTAQSEFTAFPHLAILDPQGRVVFRYGHASHDGDGQPWARTLPPPWYLDRERGDLYRVLIDPLWLGPEGRGASSP